MYSQFNLIGMTKEEGSQGLSKDEVHHHMKKILKAVRKRCTAIPLSIALKQVQATFESPINITSLIFAKLSAQPANFFEHPEPDEIENIINSIQENLLEKINFELITQVVNKVKEAEQKSLPAISAKDVLDSYLIPLATNIKHLIYHALIVELFDSLIEAQSAQNFELANNLVNELSQFIQSSQISKEEKQKILILLSTKVHNHFKEIFIIYDYQRLRTARNMIRTLSNLVIYSQCARESFQAKRAILDRLITDAVHRLEAFAYSSNFNNEMQPDTYEKYSDNVLKQIIADLQKQEIAIDHTLILLIINSSHPLYEMLTGAVSPG